MSHATPEPHDPRWGRWWQGRNRKGVMRFSRICLFPDCRRKQTKPDISDEEFFERARKAYGL